MARAWASNSAGTGNHRLLEPAGLTPSDLVRSFVAVAEPAVVLAPYLGVWDAFGQAVYAYDLLALDPFPGMQTTAGSLGVAAFDDPYGDEAMGADFAQRRHGDVVQIVVGREVALVPDLACAPAEHDQWFYDGLHDYAGHTIPWHRVRRLGSAFERADLLAAAGLSLAVLLEALRLLSPESSHAVRAASSPDRGLLHALLS